MASIDKPRLIVRFGGSEWTAPLDKPKVVIGRSPAADLSIDDRNLSRAHCEIRREGGRCWLVDPGSKNGTLVNGRRVKTHDLSDGDRITMGDAVLYFNRAPERSRPGVRAVRPRPALGALAAWIPLAVLAAGATAAVWYFAAGPRSGSGLPPPEAVAAPWREYVGECGSTSQMNDRSRVRRVFQEKYEGRIVTWSGCPAS